MINILRFRRSLVFVTLMLFLVGCSSDPQSPKEAFEESQAAMEEIDAVQVNQFDGIGENKSNYVFQTD